MLGLRKWNTGVNPLVSTVSGHPGKEGGKGEKEGVGGRGKEMGKGGKITWINVKGRKFCIAEPGQSSVL